MTESDQSPKRPVYSRATNRKRLDDLAKEDPEAMRKIGENTIQFTSHYVTPVPRSHLQDFVAAHPAPEPIEFDWEDGQTPYELSKANRDASEATAELLRQMVASNAAASKSNRRTTWINTALAAVSCAAAVFAAVLMVR